MPLDIITLGEALIDLPATQSGVSLTDAPGFTKVPAGAPGNVAAAAAALGLKAALLSKVGHDPFGRCLVEHFHGLGVDTSHMIEDPDARTGLAFVSVMPDGSRDFLFYFDPSRDFALRPDEIDFDWLHSARVLHYGSISLIAEPSRSATLAAAGHLITGHLIQGSRAVCSYDPNLRPWLWPDAAAMRAGVMQGFQTTNLVKISVDELLFLYPDAADEKSAIGSLFREHPNLRLVAVTEAALGCRGYTSAGNFAEAPGFAVDFVDATGAGDSFTAGLLAFLLRQGPDLSETLNSLGPVLPDALRYANACGALATTHLGASPKSLTEEAIQVLLRSRK